MESDLEDRKIRMAEEIWVVTKKEKSKAKDDQQFHHSKAITIEILILKVCIAIVDSNGMNNFVVTDNVWWP